MPRSDIDKHFELALRGFLDDLEAHLYPAQVIGIDFVAAYGDGVTFTDFLLHPNPSDFFSRLRDGYFKNNPSLMLVPGAEEFSLPLDGELLKRLQRRLPTTVRFWRGLGLKRLANLVKRISLLRLAEEDRLERLEFYRRRTHEFLNFQVELDQTAAVPPDRAGVTIDKWVESIHEIYHDCRHLYFIKADFEQIPSSGLFVYLDKRITVGTLQKELLKEKALSFLRKGALDVVVPGQFERITQLATKAAISQVMARNMSHNIGSHVLTKFKLPDQILSNHSVFSYSDGLNDSYEEPNSRHESGTEADSDDEALKDDTVLAPEVQYDSSFHRNLNSDDELKNENQIAYFNEYLKNRMDLLADIATADPVMESPMFLYSEVFKGIDRNRILLNRISGISDSDLKFGIRIVDSRGGSSKEINTRTLRTGESEDILLSMTNDVLGAQAFYIILENIIRNIYKHSQMTALEKKQTLVLSVDVAENPKHPSYYEISIYDSLAKRHHPNREDEDEIGSILKRRNRDFNQPLLDPKDSDVRPTGLGTIEMDVCAAYLRCLPVDKAQEQEEYDLEFCGDGNNRTTGDHDHDLGSVVNNEDREDDPMLMFAYKQRLLTDAGVPVTNDGEPQYSLGYKLYIPKPKEVLVIQNDEMVFSIAGVEPRDFIAHGITVLTLAQLETELLVNREVFKHQILYVHADGSALQQLLEKQFAGLPKRIVNHVDEEFTNPRQFVSRIWEAYAAEVCLGNGNQIEFSCESTNQSFKSSRGRLIRVSLTQVHESTSTIRVFIDNHDVHWCEKPTCEDHKCGECHRCLGDQCYCLREDYVPQFRDYYDMRCGHTRLNETLISDLTTGDLDIRLAENGLDPEEDEIYREIVSSRAQYLDVVFTKIAVIDERIQANMATKAGAHRRRYRDNFELLKYFRQQGLYIPTAVEADLNVSTFGDMDTDGDTAFQIRAWLRWCLKNENVKFCVVHLGLIEKMIKKDDEKDGKDSEAVDKTVARLFENFEEYQNRLVITSGRGTPDNLPNEITIPFVPLAPIQNAIETQFDKYLLTKLLFNSRRTN